SRPFYVPDICLNHVHVWQIRGAPFEDLQEYIAKNKMIAFAEVEIVPDFRTGATIMVQAHGIGGVTVNSILMGWSRKHEGRISQLHLMRDMVALGKSVLFLRSAPNHGFGVRERIDVWWQGGGGNEDLMLLLTYLIERHPSWNKALVRLIRVVNDNAAVPDVTTHMLALIDDIRVDAVPHVIVKEKDEAISDVIRENSQQTDLTILGMALPEPDDIETYAERLDSLVSGIGSVLLVRNAELQYDIIKAS
ncbi:MAG: hypothetical protein AAF125_20350, partial [Chloroflexota bacterium]